MPHWQVELRWPPLLLGSESVCDYVLCSVDRREKERERDGKCSPLLRAHYYATEIVAGAADHVRPLTSTLTGSGGVAW